MIVILTRHAETEDDGTRDPGLSDAGRTRAERFADSLSSANIGAVFATEYRRTRETAAPLARRHGLEVEVIPFDDGTLESFVLRLAERIRAHVGQHGWRQGVVVVGHSNTTPALAEALTGKSIPPIDEAEYDRVIRIVLHSDGADYMTDVGSGR